MATFTPSYAASSALTITLASLATSSTFVAGVESNQVDNTSNKYDDAFLEGFITVGTTPTISTQIQVYVWGAAVSLATTAKDVLDGTDSAETLTSVGVGAGFLRQIANLQVDSTTSDRRYGFGMSSVAEALGLPSLPPFWGVFVTHNTGVNLNSTAGNQAVSFVGVKFDVA
jgi:hypothetical protein